MIPPAPGERARELPHYLRLIPPRDRNCSAGGWHARHKGAAVCTVAIRVIELPVCGRYRAVRYCRLAHLIRSSPPMGPDGVSGLDGNTHRHDPGVSTASVS